MLPSINDGDLIIYKPFNYKKDLIFTGLLVVVNHPLEERTLIVKRISKVNSFKVEILGDNSSESNDSRQFGAINKSTIQGIVEKIITKKNNFLDF